jgi:dTDP-4-amino-4,6-dideoxygalactose transaminase
MNGFKAGFLLSWSYLLETSNRQRTDVAGFYKKDLGLGNEKPIYSKAIPFLRFPFYGEDSTWKEDVCRRYGYLGISPMYPDSINNIGVLRGRVGKGPFPGAETIAKSILTLPTHSFLNGIDKSRICSILKNRLSLESARL